MVEAFGLEKRGLTTANRKQIAHWYQDLGYNIEMIRMAYERTVDQIGQVSFPLYQQDPRKLARPSG